MLKPTLIAVLLAGALTACLFGNDKDERESRLTLTGALMDLDTLPPATPDSGGATYDVWFLPVDEGELDELAGTSCFYTGYLGDSAQTLYTNDLMAGEKAVDAFRSEGIELYRDTTQPDYTHYRAVFDCFD